MQFLMQPQFQCALTGRTNLTYQRALASEMATRADMERRMPWKEVRCGVLRLLHGQGGRMDKIVDYVAEEVSKRFWVGERVLIVDQSIERGHPYRCVSLLGISPFV